MGWCALYLAVKINLLFNLRNNWPRGDGARVHDRGARTSVRPESDGVYTRHGI